MYKKKVRNNTGHTGREREVRFKMCEYKKKRENITLSISGDVAFIPILQIN